MRVRDNLCHQRFAARALGRELKRVAASEAEEVTPEGLECSDQEPVIGVLAPRPDGGGGSRRGAAAAQDFKRRLGGDSRLTRQ